MTTMPSGPSTRVAFAAQQMSRSVRSVHVRQSTANDEQYDSDSEMSQKRTMRRGKRTVDQRASSFAARHLWRRQNMWPAVQPRDEEEEEDEDKEGEESSESSGSSDSSSSSSSSDSSDSSPEDAEKDDADSDADSIDSGSDSESDKEEDDKKKEDEKKEKEKEKETQTQPAPSSGLPSSAPSAPGFQTLVPGAPPPEEQPRQSSSAPAPPAQTQAPPSSSAKPTLTTTTRPAAEPTTQPQPAETLINEGPIPDSDATTTSAERLSTATGQPATGDPASASQIGDSSSGSPRGTDVGIVIGTLAIAGLLIAAGIFFFRKRRQANQGRLERLPDEKSLPPDPPTFRLSAPPAAARAPRTQSSIMDEAIGAAYQNEVNQTYAQPNLSQDFIPVAYDQNSGGGMTAAAAAAAPVSPISPRANHLSPEWQPASPRGQQPTQPYQPMANFQLFPPPNPPPMVPPPPVKFNQAQGPFTGAEPPGSFAYNQGQRNSFAQTESTEGEGTWSTFAVERMRANDGKLPLKERMFGRF